MQIAIWGIAVSIVALFCTVIGMIFGGLKYIDNRILRVDDRHQAKLEGTEKTLNTRIDAMGTETRLTIEKVEEAERRSRHDLANNVMTQLGEIRRDIRRIEQESVSKTDLTSLEHRMESRFDKMDGKIDKICERLNVAPSHG